MKEESLTSLKKFKGYRIHAKDGEIGKIEDFYFDDALWRVRHVVVDTGTWLPGKEVLLYPGALGRPDDREHDFHVGLTKKEIEESPNPESDKPMSMQAQERLYEYFSWPVNWPKGGFYNEIVPKPPFGAEPEEEREDPHLRSFNEVLGYHIQALNGEVGHIEDFIIDDEKWQIRYLVTDTRNWLPGKRVLIYPGWLDALSWDEERAYVDLSMEDIKDAPAYEHGQAITREYEEEIFEHYGKQPYWKHGKEKTLR